MQTYKKEIIIDENTIKYWQELLNIIAIRLKVPVALIMKVDLPEIKVFLASKSEGNPYKPGESAPLIGSGLYCERVCKTKRELLVPNALNDKEWNKNPDIKLGMISYMGFPIFWPDGEIFGTICVLDVKENSYNAEYRSAVLQCKEYIEAYLDLEASKYLQKDLSEINSKTQHYHDLFFKVEKLLHK